MDLWLLSALVSIAVVVGLFLYRLEATSRTHALCSAVSAAGDERRDLGATEVGGVPAVGSEARGGSLRARRTAWGVGALGLLIVRAVCGVTDPVQEPLFGTLGAVAGELWYRRRCRVELARQVRGMEQELPMFMERIVMAVGSGLDIVPALGVAIQGMQSSVTESMAKVVALAEAGLPLATALRTVSAEVPAPAFKHALVHLAVAYQQGGELVRPLRELSDATQLQFQESVEEEIAKLPVRAVLPLVLTFTGLILCFLTVPLLQVASITQKVSDATRE